VKVNPLKSHLFWFILLGASIFAVDSIRSRDSDEIVVDEGVARRIAALWEMQMQRPPDREELDGLIHSWIDEEILYREARKLELDREDVIIRRRLVQKIDFIAEESAVEEPSDESLKRYFDEHAEKYRLPVRYTFSQVYFRAATDARKILDKLAAGQDWRQVGEVGMASPSWSSQSERDITNAFGKSFTRGIESLQPGTNWQGPIRSEFGWHWVRLEERLDAAPATFESVRDRVLNDYLYDARSNARQQYLDRLYGKYPVVWKLSE